MSAERLEQLERLARLRADDMLTDEEFAVEKGRVLSEVDSVLAVQLAEKPPRRRIWLVTGLVAVVGAGLLGGAFVINDLPGGPPAPVLAVTANTPLRRTPMELIVKPILPEPRMGCTGSACRVLTARGWARIEAGMNVIRAEKVSGLKLRDDGHYEGVEGCARYEVVGGPSALSMLVEGGVITSLSTAGKGWRTDRGVKVGDSESAVRNTYSPLRQEPDIYGDASDKILFFDTEKRKFGLVFGIKKRKVSWITVGGSSRGYVEGCL